MGEGARRVRPPPRSANVKQTTGWVWLIRRHSSAQLSFELSGNSNYNFKLLLDIYFLLIFKEVISTFKRIDLLRITCKI